MSLGEISVTIQAINEATPTFDAIGSDAANMASVVAGSPMTLNVQNLVSPQINQVGKRQTFETLISEEAFLLAKYLRNERRD